MNSLHRIKEMQEAAEERSNGCVGPVGDAGGFMFISSNHELDPSEKDVDNFVDFLLQQNVDYHLVCTNGDIGIDSRVLRTRWEWLDKCITFGGSEVESRKIELDLSVEAVRIIIYGLILENYGLPFSRNFVTSLLGKIGYNNIVDTFNDPDSKIASEIILSSFRYGYHKHKFISNYIMKIAQKENRIKELYDVIKQSDSKLAVYAAKKEINELVEKGVIAPQDWPLELKLLVRKEVPYSTYFW